MGALTARPRPGRRRRRRTAHQRRRRRVGRRAWSPRRSTTARRSLTGGSAPDGPGHFYPPTVLLDVPAEARINQEEIFGPVAPITTFDTEEEAVARANASEYGLTSYVYTRDLARTIRLAESLEFGMVGVNTGLVSNPAAPFGGVKASGFGREGGFEGIDEYLETTYVRCPATDRRVELYTDVAGSTPTSPGTPATRRASGRGRRRSSTTRRCWPGSRPAAGQAAAQPGVRGGAAGTASRHPDRTPGCARRCSATTGRSAPRSWSGPRRPTRSAGWRPWCRVRAAGAARGGSPAGAARGRGERRAVPLPRPLVLRVDAPTTASSRPGRGRG